MKEVFLQLVRLGIGTDATVSLSDGIDWDAVETLAKQHGMMGIVCDAVKEFKGFMSGKPTATDNLAAVDR